MKNSKPNLAGMSLYLFAIAYALLTLLIGLRFKFKLSQYFAGHFTSLHLDVILYLVFLVPFFFIGSYLYKKGLMKIDSKYFLLFTGALILLPLLDAILLQGICLSIFAFGFGFALGFSNATAFALVYSMYAVAATLVYSSIKKQGSSE